MIKYIKPTTSSKRHLIQLKLDHLKKKPLLKNSIHGLRNINGRNNSGKITVRHKGNGHKKKYRIVNFKRNYESSGIVTSLEYDPNRNSHLASIYEKSTNSFFYILRPKNIKIGDILKSGKNQKNKLGYSIPLKNIPVGSFIHSISINKFNGAKFTRAAGTFAKIKEKTINRTDIKLSSGKLKTISSECYATIGVVSNEFHFLKQLGKAGRSRWLNRRPSVRGVAMNPIDHPHGGGEGKKSGKGKTPWGKPVKRGPKIKNFK